MTKDSIIMTKQEAFDIGFRHFQEGRIRAVAMEFYDEIHTLAQATRLELMKSYLSGWDSANLIAELMGD